MGERRLKKLEDIKPAEPGRVIGIVMTPDAIEFLGGKLTIFGTKVTAAVSAGPARGKKPDGRWTSARLTVKQVHEIRERTSKGQGPAEIGRAMGLDRNICYRVSSGKGYADVR